MDPAVRAELDEAIRAASSEQLVQGSQRVLAVLSKHGLVQKQVIAPALVGCHPDNRDGLGLNYIDVWELIASIAAVGWDWQAPNPICVELRPGDEAAERFNQKLSEASGGVLPPNKAHELRYGSVSCSHTNAALRCLSQSAAGHEELHQGLLMEGQLSLELLRKRDPEFAQAAEQGLAWRVVSDLAVKEFPSLPGLLQSASNCTGQLAKPESEMQVVRRICNGILTATVAKLPHGWADMKGSILRSRPACSQAAPFMHRFLMKFSVGVPGLLERTEQNVKSMAPSNRQLGHEFFEALGTDPKPATADPCV